MASDWINHVKKYAKENGIKYGEALSKAGATFKKSAAPAMMEASPVAMKTRSKKSRKSKKARGSKKRRTARRR